MYVGMHIQLQRIANFQISNGKKYHLYGCFIIKPIIETYATTRISNTNQDKK